MNIQEPRAPERITPPLPGARTLSTAITAILFSPTQLIFARGPVFAALAIPLHNRIAAASRRIANLLARLANGTWRPHTPKPGTKGGPPSIYLPHSRAWIIAKLGHHAAAYASQLEFLLLHTPQTCATIAAAPPEAQKSLARLLGVTLPPELQPPPRPTPAPRPPKPPRPKPEPHRHPIYPQRKPRFILYPDPPRRKTPA